MQNMFITWERHRRTRNISDKFDLELVELVSHHAAMLRYSILIAKTLLVFIRARPAVVFCQNPSLVLCVLCCILKTVFGFQLIVDRHSSFKFETRRSPSFKYKVFHLLSDWTLRSANLTIVTNDTLANFVRNKNGRAFVLPDPIPDMPSDDPNSANYFVFVSSYGTDENIENVIDAFRLLPQFSLYITGNYKAGIDAGMVFLLDLPENVFLTGFIADQEYIQLLSEAAGIIVYTSNEYTLTCGAYEGVALGKPMILSATRTMRRLFKKGAVYCNGTSASFVESVKDLMRTREELISELVNFRSDYISDWEHAANDLWKHIK